MTDWSFGQTLNNLRDALVSGDMKRYAREFLESKGLPLDTKFTDELRKEMAEFMTNKIMNRHKEGR